jgi:hypothetical protein
VGRAEFDEGLRYQAIAEELVAELSASGDADSPLVYRSQSYSARVFDWSDALKGWIGLPLVLVLVPPACIAHAFGFEAKEGARNPEMGMIGEVFSVAIGGYTYVYNAPKSPTDPADGRQQPWSEVAVDDWTSPRFWDSPLLDPVRDITRSVHERRSWLNDRFVLHDQE